MEKIEKYINKIKYHISYYENNISNYILRHVTHNIKYPLMIIFNLSLS